MLKNEYYKTIIPSPNATQLMNYGIPNYDFNLKKK